MNFERMKVVSGNREEFWCSASESRKENKVMTDGILKGKKGSWGIGQFLKMDQQL